MVIVKNNIIPALFLNKKTDSDLNTYALERISSITLNALKFPGLKPSAAEVTEKQEEYSLTLQNLVKGNKSSTVAKNEARAELEKTLTLQAQNCSEIADGDATIYLLSGYGIKAKPQPSGALVAPKNFSAKNGTQSGSIEGKFKSVEHAHSYEMRVKDENDKVVATGITSSSPVVVTELETLKVYTVMVRAIGAKGKKGEWTNEITVSVI